MPEGLAAALVAVAIAGAAYLRAELELRRARAERQAERERLDDVQRRVGADRRVSDPGHPE